MKARDGSGYVSSKVNTTKSSKSLVNSGTRSKSVDNSLKAIDAS